MDKVLAAIETLRAPLASDEYNLHAKIAEALARTGLPCLHEARLAKRCRIDFLCGSVGIEIKRGRPQKAALLKQLGRYAQSERIARLIIVCEHGFELPASVEGKPLCVVSLNKLWGVADENAETAGKPAKNNLPCVAEACQDRREPASEDETIAQNTGFISQSSLPEVSLSAPEQNASVPSYLLPPVPAQHTYGVLSYNRRRKCWTIRAEPCVTELCKRLFPGSEGGRRGEARFTAHRRIVGDLNWIMLRYPLKIAPQDAVRWQSAMEDAREYAAQKEASRIAPRFVDPPKGDFLCTLMPFQREGTAWLCHTRRGLLADEMGLGKTVQALGCLSATGSFPCLLVVPPHLIRNWLSEIRRFLRIGGREARVHVIKGLKPGPLPEADVYLMHYLLLRGWKTVLPDIPFRAVVFDEIQELRHGGTEKYSAASLVAESCERVIGLSGTPIYNQGGEIWNIVNILDFHFLGDFESFTREWCYGYGNNIVEKPELLGEHLRREGIMLRRTKREVLPELPEKRRLVQEIDTDNAMYMQLMQPVLENLHIWRENGSLTPSERALLEDRISQEERCATGVAKAQYVCQFVRALLENGEAVLLFAHHHAVMDIYREELHAFSPVFITGRESGAQKEQAVERFMDGKTRLCCVSLRAASGLNLQRATCVVFGEMDWSPAVHSQAEDRAHRIGMRDSLLCYYLVSPRGSDADIQEALGLKVSQFLGLMGDTPLTSEQAAAGASIARRHVERMLARGII